MLPCSGWKPDHHMWNVVKHWETRLKRDLQGRTERSLSVRTLKPFRQSVHRLAVFFAPAVTNWISTVFVGAPISVTFVEAIAMWPSHWIEWSLERLTSHSMRSNSYCSTPDSQKHTVRRQKRSHMLEEMMEPERPLVWSCPFIDLNGNILYWEARNVSLVHVKFAADLQEKKQTHATNQETEGEAPGGSTMYRIVHLHVCSTQDDPVAVFAYCANSSGDGQVNYRRLHDQRLILGQFVPLPMQTWKQNTFEMFQKSTMGLSQPIKIKAMQVCSSRFWLTLAGWRSIDWQHSLPHQSPIEYQDNRVVNHIQAEQAMTIFYNPPAFNWNTTDWCIRTFWLWSPLSRCFLTWECQECHVLEVQISAFSFQELTFLTMKWSQFIAIPLLSALGWVHSAQFIFFLQMSFQAQIYK